MLENWISANIPNNQGLSFSNDLSRTFKDLTGKDKDKDRAFKDQDKDKDLSCKDKDKDLKLVLKESLRTRTRINITAKNTFSFLTENCAKFIFLPRILLGRLTAAIHGSGLPPPLPKKSTPSKTNSWLRLR